MQEAGPFPSVPDLRGVISACCWCFPCLRLFKRRGKERWSLQDLLCVFKSLMLSNHLLLLPLSHTALKTAKTVFKKIKYQQIGLLFSVCDRMLREPDCNFLKGDWPATVQCFVPALDAILSHPLLLHGFPPNAGAVRDASFPPIHAGSFKYRISPRITIQLIKSDCEKYSAVHTSRSMGEMSPE